MAMTRVGDFNLEWNRIQTSRAAVDSLRLLGDVGDAAHDPYRFAEDDSVFGEGEVDLQRVLRDGR